MAGPRALAPACCAVLRCAAQVAFTGSTDVGKTIMAGAAENIKPVTLELGGNSPVVVCPDADVQAAAEGAHFALFFNIGAAELCLGALSTAFCAALCTEACWGGVTPRWG
jgi:hypothetical protein